VIHGRRSNTSVHGCRSNTGVTGCKSNTVVYGCRCNTVVQCSGLHMRSRRRAMAFYDKPSSCDDRPARADLLVVSHCFAPFDSRDS
jgi:hypothetical protein